VFCEEREERNGQGVGLGFVCTNANCNAIQMPFNSSSKSGELFDINRASTLAFRAIGRGQLAAAKTLSILGLSKPSSKPVWCENTKIIADVCSELVREELKHSARELKEPRVETDDEGYCSTAVSFDGSWCSSGWTARDGVVAGISPKTGKVLDVMHLSSSCSTCDRLEKLHSGCVYTDAVSNRNGFMTWKPHRKRHFASQPILRQTVFKSMRFRRLHDQ